MTWWRNVFIEKKSEKLVPRHDKVSSEVILKDYDEAMQIRFEVGSVEHNVRLA